MRIAVVHNRDQSGVINVFGPQNRERYNPRTVERVAKALEQGGHTVRVIDGNMHVVEQLQSFMPRVMAGDRPGMVFNMAYGIQGVSRYTHLPAMLEMLGVPYVGSDPQAHALALDKVIAKIVFESAGLPTAKFWNFASPDDRFDDLVFPVIVKPKMEAVSFGIQVVNDEKELREAVDFLVREFQQHVLVEQFIPGREFAIGLLGNGDPEVLPIVEIDLEGDPDAIQSADEKLRKPRGKICPAELPPEQAEELRALTRKAFRSLGLRDFSRVDLRMDADGKPYILEINSMASLGLTGTYVHAAKTAGYSFEDLVNRILDVAAVRYFGEEFHEEAGEEAAPLPAPSSRKKPARVSARVRSYLRSHETTIEDSLRRMVSFRTPPAEVERVNALGEWVAAQLRPMGFEEHTYTGVGVGLVHAFSNHAEEESDVLILGHLDSSWRGDFAPFRTEGTRIFGTGVAESKGGLAVALAALRALRYSRELKKLRCTVLLTSDETLHGARSRSIVAEMAAKARYVIGLKPGEPGGGLVLSRSGRSSYTAEVGYRRARKEISQPGVVTHFTRRLLDFQELSTDDVRVAVTTIDLRGSFDRLPEHAQSTITVRFAHTEGADLADAQIRKVAGKRGVPGVKVDVTGGVRRPPMVATEARQAFLTEVQRIAEELSQRVEGHHRWHSADICYVPDDVVALDGFGPAGFQERTSEEHIVRHSLIERAALLSHVLIHCRSTRS